MGCDSLNLYCILAIKRNLHPIISSLHLNTRVHKQKRLALPPEFVKKLWALNPEELLLTDEMEQSENIDSCENDNLRNNLVLESEL